MFAASASKLHVHHQEILEYLGGWSCLRSCSPYRIHWMLYPFCWKSFLSKSQWRETAFLVGPFGDKTFWMVDKIWKICSLQRLFKLFITETKKHQLSIKHQPFSMNNNPSMVCNHHQPSTSLLILCRSLAACCLICGTWQLSWPKPWWFNHWEKGWRGVNRTGVVDILDNRNYTRCKFSCFILFTWFYWYASIVQKLIEIDVSSSLWFNWKSLKVPMQEWPGVAVCNPFATWDFLAWASWPSLPRILWSCRWHVDHHCHCRHHQHYHCFLRCFRGCFWCCGCCRWRRGCQHHSHCLFLRPRHPHVPPAIPVMAQPTRPTTAKVR